MSQQISPRKLSIIAGQGYLIIFFSAIFANFFVVEKIIENPLFTVENNPLLVGFGIIAFLVTVVFDVVVAWALYELYKSHLFSSLSTLFRLIHAIIMGIAVYKLAEILELNSSGEILSNLKEFNIIWLIGLFFFGIHLMMLGKIIDGPKAIKIVLTIAGIAYMADTIAHFAFLKYDDYATMFLIFVATFSIIGEMSFAIWLLTKSRKTE